MKNCSKIPLAIGLLSKSAKTNLWRTKHRIKVESDVNLRFNSTRRTGVGLRTQSHPKRLVGKSVIKTSQSGRSYIKSKNNQKNKWHYFTQNPGGWNTDVPKSNFRIIRGILFVILIEKNIWNKWYIFHYEVLNFFISEGIPRRSKGDQKGILVLPRGFLVIWQIKRDCEQWANVKVAANLFKRGSKMGFKGDPKGIQRGSKGDSKGIQREL